MLSFCFTSFRLEWGFFGHRRINRMAVFTLPPPLVGFYKKHIDYVTEHAVDPDKRRYATKHEGVRHYVDLDRYGKAPFGNLPHNWVDALRHNTSIFILSENDDTLQLIDGQGAYSSALMGKDLEQITGLEKVRIEDEPYRNFFYNNILPNYYEDEWQLDCDSVSLLLSGALKVNCQSAFAKDHITENGILPYHLIQMQRRLTRGFKEKNVKEILRLSSDFGHYIGDAFVPLHTTENYNGQLTDQIGIHAFWETRIPELFADQSFDYFVGQASYINDPESFYWDIVLHTHQYVDTVLAIEKELSISFPEDQQYCYDERSGSTVRLECRAYAAAFRERMKGMVEQQFHGAIHTVGSAWFTAWVDAGQPDLNFMDEIILSQKEREEQQKLEAKVKSGKIQGRAH